MDDITMNDIQKAVAETSRKEFIDFAKKDYWSVRQMASRLVGRLRGKRVWSYREFLKELNDLSDVLYPNPEVK
jgi:hypothetical protein